MKLVDLDKVRWTDGFYDMLTGEQFAPMIFNTEERIEWAIANAKVDAIPVEWIDDYIKRRVNVDGIYAEIRCIGDMIKEWEKENQSLE